MSDIVVIGSCVQDLVSYTERFPAPGESVRGHSFASGFGGKGANQAVAAARLGSKVAMVAKVGNDIFGPSTVANFMEQGINADHVEVADGESTATATITVADSGNIKMSGSHSGNVECGDIGGQNSIVVVLGANMRLSVEDVGKAEALVQSAKVLCVQLEVCPKISLAALQLARKHGVKTILNPAPGLPDLDVELVRAADVIIPNESEAEFLTHIPITGPEAAARAALKLRSMGAGTVVVTLGEKGVVFLAPDSEDPQHLDCPKVKAVDTTGAGDAFVGAFAHFLGTRSELGLGERVRRAMLVASHSVTLPGTQASYPHPRDLDPAILA